MTITELNQKISAINSETKRLNNERQVNIGKRDTLTQQLNSALADYKSKYGVDITSDNLEAEISRISALKEKEVANIEQVLSLIQQEKYVDATNLINTIKGVSSDSETPTQPAQASTPIQASAPVKDDEVKFDEPISEPLSQNTVMPDNKPVAQTVVEPQAVQQQVTPSVPQPSMSAPTPPIDDDISIPVAPPVMPSSPITPSVAEPVPVSPSEPSPSKLNLSGIDALNNFEAVTPTAPSAPTSQPSKLSGLDLDSSEPDSPTRQQVASFNAILGGTVFQSN